MKRFLHTHTGTLVSLDHIESIEIEQTMDKDDETVLGRWLMAKTADQKWLVDMTHDGEDDRNPAQWLSAILPAILVEV